MLSGDLLSRILCLEDNSAASSDAPCDNEGCLWRGPKQDKRSHLAKCPLASVSCPNANAGCGRAGVRQVIEEHLKNGCEFAGRRVEDEMYRTIQPGIPESVSPTTEQIDDDDEKQTKIQRFNFMVAGGAGLGKTTFLPTFFEVFGKPDDQNSLNNVTKIKASVIPLLIITMYFFLIDFGLAREERIDERNQTILHR